MYYNMAHTICRILYASTLPDDIYQFAVRESMGLHGMVYQYLDFGPGDSF